MYSALGWIAGSRLDGLSEHKIARGLFWCWQFLKYWNHGVSSGIEEYEHAVHFRDRGEIDAIVYSALGQR